LMAFRHHQKIKQKLNKNVNWTYYYPKVVKKDFPHEKNVSTTEICCKIIFLFGGPKCF